MISPVLADVGLALEQDEEFAAGLAQTCQVLALGEVDLVGDLRNLLELAPRAVCEERHALEQLDLVVASSHKRECKRLGKAEGNRNEPTRRMG